MPTKCIEFEIDNHQVATVSLNRPNKHNGLDMTMIWDLDKCIKQIAKSKAIKAVIIRGYGPSFSAGLDVKSVLKSKVNLFKLLFKWNPYSANLVQRLAIGWRKLPIPVIAAIHGHCYGAGLQIAMGCDFRIASSNSLLALKESDHGLLPDMAATLMMKRHLPLDQSMLMAMLGRSVSAADALQYHLITEIDDRPYQRAQQLAKRLVGRDQQVNAKIKSLYYKSQDMSDRRILAAETRIIRSLIIKRIFKARQG